MIPVQADKGQIFVDEGEPLTKILILENGALARTKLSVNQEELADMRSSLRQMTENSRHKSLVNNSVLIDRIEGRGRISGLLHSCHQGNNTELLHAFATVSVDSEQGAKVWIMNSDDFRDVISQEPEFALAMLASMARELRVGSKSLRGLMEKKLAGRDGGAETDDRVRLVKVLCYDTTSWVSEGFIPAVKAFNEKQLEAKEGSDAVIRIHMDFTTERLSEQSATYAAGYDAVCLFVNDDASERVLQTLSQLGVEMLALRCAGFDRVDTRAATAYQMTVARVPAYSPYAVAEMAVALLMAVNRKIAKASARVKMANFTLDAGLMGMDVHGKNVGVMGTGKIGQILVNIMLGFGSNVLAYDVYESDEVKKAGATYVSKEEIYKQCDIIFLMMPLLKPTYHTINEEAIQQMKPGTLLINTSRGGLMDTKAVLKGLQAGILGGVGMDVYEHEQAYFFQDWSARHITDPDLVALLGMTNVTLTAHQAFFTKEAVDKIVDTTLYNIAEYKQGKKGQAHTNNCLPK